MSFSGPEHLHSNDSEPGVTFQFKFLGNSCEFQFYSVRKSAGAGPAVTSTTSTSVAVLLTGRLVLLRLIILDYYY